MGPDHVGMEMIDIRYIGVVRFLPYVDRAGPGFDHFAQAGEDQAQLAFGDEDDVAAVSGAGVRAHQREEVGKSRHHRALVGGGVVGPQISCRSRLPTPVIRIGASILLAWKPVA